MNEYFRKYKTCLEEFYFGFKWLNYLRESTHVHRHQGRIRKKIFSKIFTNLFNFQMLLRKKSLRKDLFCNSNNGHYQS